MTTPRSPDPPLLLLSNDDGIDSWFLEAVVHALVPHYEVAVVAPADEMSWIGRAISHQKTLRFEPEDRYPCTAWRVHQGTPADCVNVALNGLLPRRPDAVISGINLGYNTTLPMILSSGTVAAAMEGCLAGIPSAAFSQQIPNEFFAEAKAHHGKSPAPLLKSVEQSAQYILNFIPHLLDPENTPPYQLHNINFPYPHTPGLATETTSPLPMGMPRLFEEGHPHEYHFRYPRVPVNPEQHIPGSDWDCLGRGVISHSLLNLKF